jgi:Peptidase propeptide and YPEB domain
MDWKEHRTMRVMAAAAVALGVAAGSYGIASAASGSGSSSASGSGGFPAATAAAAAQGTQPQGWGPQRSDETLLSGETASKVQAAAKAKEPNATVSRVETDADGHAAYEVHMIRSDGTLVTVYVDKQFKVVGEETGMPAQAGQPGSGQPTA